MVFARYELVLRSQAKPSFTIPMYRNKNKLGSEVETREQVQIWISGFNLIFSVQCHIYLAMKDSYRS